MDKDIQAIIFDCDGVLVDSEYYSCYALNILFEKYYNIDIGNDYTQVLGTSLKSTINYYFDKFKITNYTDSDLQKFFEEKDGIYKQLAKNKLKTFPGIEELIKFALKNDIKIAVGSSGTLNKILFSLRETGLDKYFKIITSSDEVIHGKPNPELFLITAKKLQLDPENCLVIEDSVSGIAAAKAANMKAIGITNTFSKDVLEKTMADKVIKNVLELLS